MDLQTLGAGSEAPTLYTVTFELTTFAELSSRPISGNVFENGRLPFLYDSRHVVEATEAVVSALNDSGALSVGGSATAFRVPVTDSDGYFTFWGGYLNDSQIPGIPVNDWYATGLGLTTDNIPVTFALFSYHAVVPVPAAVWLFGSALGAMGWMRRKALTL
ncbi:MAG: VPLPA-CTERM sorting domain-containing protein [Gammaproteobacteria bacterium]